MLSQQSVKNKQSIKTSFEKDHIRLNELFKNFQYFRLFVHKRALDYFNEFKFGLEKHILLEEEIIFPIFEQKSGLIGIGPTVVMREEHKKIKEHLRLIEKELQNNNFNTYDEEEKLLSVLISHDLKEENTLYPAIDKYLDEKEKSFVIARLEKIQEEYFSPCSRWTNHHSF